MPTSQPENKEILNYTEIANNNISHESSLYAEPIFHIGDFSVTNALFTSWIVILFLIILSITIRIKIKKIPGKLQNFFEIIIEQALSLGDQVTNNRKITEKAFPVIFTVFLVIILNNWMGILPLGGLGIIEMTEHGKVFIPLIRSGTADVNGTISLAILSVIGANVFGIISIGLWKSINKYVNLKVIGEIFIKIKKDPFIIMTAPIMFAVGLIELVGELAKVASLSFRLFGNVFAGEVLLASMAAIFIYILPTPFILLEVFVGLIQAFIFAILTLVYYTISGMDHDEDEHEHKEENKLNEAY